MGEKMIQAATGFLSQDGNLLKAAVLVAAAAAAMAAVAIWLYAANRRHERLLDDPAVAAARRLTRFYLDRPLQAALVLEMPDRKSARQAAKQDFPECSPGNLRQAVWAAEYNEFVAWELRQEIMSFRKAFPKASQKALKMALQELKSVEPLLPRGMSLRICTRKGWCRESAYSLKDAHAWLDQVSPDGVPAAEAFQAVKANRFSCARCGRDWNDGALLRVVRSETGSLVPICEKCRT